MEEKLKNFDEFQKKGWSVSTDMGSAWFDGGRVHIEGSATKDGDKRDVTVTVAPENTEGLDSDKLDKEDLERKVKLMGVEDVQSKQQIIP